MSLKLTLFYHPLCPFAQRILHVANFKSLQIDLKPLDLSEKNESYLKENPDGSTPALKVSTQSASHIIKDSLIISQYLETLEGPPLYPRLPGNQTNALERALIDMRIHKTIEPLRKVIGTVYHKSNPTAEEVLQFEAAIKKLTTLVPDGKFFTFSILGRDELSFIDLMAFPLIERIVAFRDLGLKFYERTDLNFILQWHSKMNSLDFIHSAQMPLSRYLYLRKYIISGKYKGLVLPVTTYDSYPYA